MFRQISLLCLSHSQRSSKRRLLAALCLFAMLGTGSVAEAGWEYYRDVYGDGNWGWSYHNYPSSQRATEEAKVACDIGTKVSHIGYRHTDGRMYSVMVYNCGGTNSRKSCWWLNYTAPNGGSGEFQMKSTGSANDAYNELVSLANANPCFKFNSVNDRCGGLTYNLQIPQPNCTGNTTIKGYHFWYWKNGKWERYIGQVSPYPYGACTLAAANKWYSEVISVAAQHNKVSQEVAKASYVKYSETTWSGSTYKCVNGFVYNK